MKDRYYDFGKNRIELDFFYLTKINLFSSAIKTYKYM